jgi:hypothetical protein
MKWNNAIALSEGWDLFQTDRDGNPPILEILKLDDPASIPELGYSEPKFECDEDAVKFVTNKAKTSKYHANALKSHLTEYRRSK